MMVIWGCTCCVVVISVAADTSFPPNVEFTFLRTGLRKDKIHTFLTILLPVAAGLLLVVLPIITIAIINRKRSVPPLEELLLVPDES